VPLYIAIPFLAVFLAFVLRRDIAEWRRQRRNRPKAAAAAAAWRQTFEAENPESPPFTPEDFEEFRAWHASLTLPAAELLPAPERPVAAGGTRIGGPVWLRDGEAWPTGADGAPLEFVAQVDFAELPPLPDFPATGVLQFFVGRDDLFGAEFDDPPAGSARVLWRPDALVDGRLHPHPALADDQTSPFERGDARDSGLSLAGQRAEHRLPYGDWRISERLEGQLRRPGIEQVDDLLEAEGDGAPLRHHVGGHPVFTQHDFREPGRFDDYDRTLLRLTSDRNLIWGDCGEAVFLIRRRDLLDRDFSSVIFYWDCT
jgi:uncharacterized protein YwqG